MEEVFPVLAGIVIALATDRVRSIAMRRTLIALLGVAFGTIASSISGELAASSFYLLIDITQVVFASVLTCALVLAWRRRRERRRFAG